MNNFCGNCGAQLVNGSCPYCNGNNVVNQQQMSNQQFQNNVNMNQNMGMSNQPVMGGVENLNLNGNSNVNNGSITNNTSASNKGIIGLVLFINYYLQYYFFRNLYALIFGVLNVREGMLVSRNFWIVLSWMWWNEDVKSNLTIKFLSGFSL